MTSASFMFGDKHSSGLSFFWSCKRHFGNKQAHYTHTVSFKDKLATSKHNILTGLVRFQPKHFLMSILPILNLQELQKWLCCNCCYFTTKSASEAISEGLRSLIFLCVCVCVCVCTCTCMSVCVVCMCVCVCGVHVCVCVWCVVCVCVDTFFLLNTYYAVKGVITLISTVLRAVTG